jgi:hypothetical protein
MSLEDVVVIDEKRGLGWQLAVTDPGNVRKYWATILPIMPTLLDEAVDGNRSQPSGWASH